MFNISLYFLCENKSEKIIRDFLKKFNADSGELLQSEVLIYRNKECLSENNLQGEWIEIKDTDSWIKIGLSEQSLAFSVYYSLNTCPINYLIITFTIEGGIIFGIEMENNETNLGYSKELLSILKNEYSAILGAIFIEEVPSFSRDSFIKAIKKRAIS
jgi:hypothetical protein